VQNVVFHPSNNTDRTASRVPQNEYTRTALLSQTRISPSRSLMPTDGQKSRLYLFHKLIGSTSYYCLSLYQVLRVETRAQKYPVRDTESFCY
jgi:hypothetical protein